MVAGGIGVEDHRQWPQAFLGPEVGAAGPQVIVENVAEERRPMAVQHPVDGHFVAVPTTGGERLELCAGGLVVGQLGLVGEHPGVGGRPVAPVDDAADVAQGGVLQTGPGVEEPGVVDRPEPVGGDEPPQAGIRRDVFVVALFGRGSAGRGVTAAEPVRRRAPGVGAGHPYSVPERVAVAIASEGRHGVDGGVLPVQIGEDATVVGEHLGRRPAVAAVGPDEHRGVRAQHLDL